MNESIAQPAQPTTPDPPALTMGTMGPELEPPKAYLKRCKEVARAVKQFVRENPSMRLLLDGKKYPYAPVWQFCAACFGVTPMVTKTEELLTDDRLEMGYLAIAHAIDRTGRIVSGAEATCMCSEQEWQGKPSFQLRSMAQTRACSKVLSNTFRHVIVLAGLCPTPAEEMGPKPQGPKKDKFQTLCDVCDCENRISDKRRHETSKKYGQGLCVPCEKEKQKKLGEATTAPLNDPRQVREFIDQAKHKKANGRPQPIVAAMDAGKEEIA